MEMFKSILHQNYPISMNVGNKINENKIKCEECGNIFFKYNNGNWACTECGLTQEEKIFNYSIKQTQIKPETIKKIPSFDVQIKNMYHKGEISLNKYVDMQRQNYISNYKLLSTEENVIIRFYTIINDTMQRIEINQGKYHNALIQTIKIFKKMKRDGNLKFIKKKYKFFMQEMIFAIFYFYTQKLYTINEYTEEISKTYRKKRMIQKKKIAFMINVFQNFNILPKPSKKEFIKKMYTQLLEKGCNNIDIIFKDFYKFKDMKYNDKEIYKTTMKLMYRKILLKKKYQELINKDTRSIISTLIFISKNELVKKNDDKSALFKRITKKIIASACDCKPLTIHNNIIKLSG